MNSLEKYSGYVYALLRVVAGLMFACHGGQKLLGMFGGKGGAQGMILVAGIIELGGMFIALGLLTRPFAFLASGMMAVAYFMAHFPTSPIPIVNKGELAVLYCFVFLYIFFRGGGPYSLDALLFRKNAVATNELGGSPRSPRTI
ncbi:MAG: DoxX family protein [Verrucomicrobiota bacterium]|nr:DoxX family protein [Verrucomicrobiota bacterium]